MGCRTSKVVNQSDSDHKEQLLVSEHAPSAVIPAAIPQQADVQEITGLDQSTAQFGRLAEDHNSSHNKIVIKIRDLDHPFAITISYLSVNLPVIIKQESSCMGQQSIIEVDEIGHDLSLIRYLCSRWNIQIVKEQLANAYIDELICNTLFRFLPNVEMIIPKWSPAISGSLPYLIWGIGRAIGSIQAYIQELSLHLEQSAFLCSDAISLADIFAAACLMPLLQLQPILNLIGTDRLQNWCQRVGIQSSQVAMKCSRSIVILSDQDDDSAIILDWIRHKTPFVLILSNDTFSMLSDIRVEKFPALILIQGEEKVHVMYGVLEIQSALKQNCQTSTDRDLPRAISSPNLAAMIYVCPTCHSLDCIHPDQIALVLFASNVHVRIDSSSAASSKNLISFHDGLVSLYETPAVLRYLTRTQHDGSILDHEMGLIDDNLTWLSQRIVPVVHDFIHGFKVQQLLELSLDVVATNLHPIPGHLLLTADRVYLSSIAFCLQRCKHYTQLSQRLQGLVTEWLEPINRRRASNLLSLLHWQQQNPC